MNLPSTLLIILTALIALGFVFLLCALALNANSPTPQPLTKPRGHSRGMEMVESKNVSGRRITVIGSFTGLSAAPQPFSVGFQTRTVVSANDSGSSGTATFLTGTAVGMNAPVSRARPAAKLKTKT